MINGKRVSETPGYGSWHQMHERCTRVTHSSYKDYGAKGIKVCKRWDKFENFVKDMGIPDKGMTLDRINSDRDYKPSNCRWASRHTQARNKKNNRFITHKGKTMVLADWEKELGIPKLRTWKRLKRGMSVKDAFEMGPRESDCKMIEYQGTRLSITGWAKVAGISIASMSKRIKNGWPLSVALNSAIQRGKRVSSGGTINALD